ncbi:MAG TPA: OmpA family protein [Flavobacteriales bacterium]|nr:OmpA family protein [Flavobacteriales bacterium]
MRARAITLWALLVAGAVHAQSDLDLRVEGEPGTVLVRAYPVGDQETAPVMQATWRSAADGAFTFAFQRLAAPEGGRQLSLARLMLTGIEQYLDQRVHFEKTGVRTDVPVERLVADIDAMVLITAQHFNTAMADGLSKPTREQLARVAHIDWSQARFGVDGGNDQDKYLAIYFYVRTQRQELERQLRADLLPLAATDVLLPEGAQLKDPGHTIEVPTICRRVFDEDNYLCALDLTPGDSGLSLEDATLTDQMMINIAAQAKKATRAEEPRMRKRDRWLKSELDRINARLGEIDQRKELWAMRDRLDAMDKRIDELGTEVDGVRQQQQGHSDNPIATLSDLSQRNLVVRFEKNSTQVDERYKVLLSEVFEQLARSPQDRLLITGYTDRGGSDEANLAISEARAKAVRAYLMERGIAGERLLVNYYGSSRSLGIDPDERRVEMEWLR